MRPVTEHLERWWEAGGREVGEVVITRDAAGYELRHRADRDCADLTTHTGAEAARHLANADEHGKYRPLKTAPNLRRGWTLRVADVRELRRALDYFYPAMTGVWAAHGRGELRPVPLRETLARQTGMYRVTQLITDAQAQELIGCTCRDADGCLKRILWELAPAQPITTLPPEKLRAPSATTALPLLCHEACNLLVAAARSVVKKAQKSA
jgi:sirohydrochlorin cobaltochelatase